MKRFLLFALALIVFAACSKDAINEQQNMQTIVDEAPETLVVGFEEGDATRIQLNEAQKTVWTNGDLVSVFYKNDANQKYEYRGETGERTAELHKISAGSSTTKMGYVVVAYPYSEEYIISPASGNLETMLPTVQHYAVDSYGVGDNLMVSCSEFTQFSLKSVCGWLKLQLTGNGEKVKCITLRGNNGEQVAGLIHVDTKSAEATLYSEQVAPDDNGNANGSLVIDGAMVTELTLDCGEGVALGKEDTAFYIALPPQTFENGLTIEIEDTDALKMTKSTDKAVIIERNTIQPMKTVEFEAEEGSYIPNNEIWYTSSDGNVVTLNITNAFGANIISNTYDNGKGVIIFDGDVTTIGDSAFQECYRLTSVNIPDSVTTIGKYAFLSCTSLTSITIPDSVTTIGGQAFTSCYSLKEFKGKYATEDGRSLIVDSTIIAYANASGNTYTIPYRVTTIEERAFYNCDSLTSVTIPDSVTTIGVGAFYDCGSLTSVNIPDSVTEIGSSAFRDCTRLTSVNIPDSVTTIGYDTFCGCGSLTSVNIPDSVTTIGNYAFAYCDSLTSVNIGDSVTTIGNYAFYYCIRLTSVNIPDSVTTIGERAFASCKSLTSVTIGDSVTTIGKEAFYLCGSLTSVNIPDSVTEIGGFAFASCKSLTSVYCYATIPPSLGDNAFYNNASGRRIYVYEECVEPYKSAWSSYKDSIYTNGQNCPDTTTIEYTTNDGNIVTTKNMLVVSNIYENGVGTLVVVGKISQIPNNAFYYCNSLTSVNIPDSVTEIGGFAFASCTSLTSVNIPDSVTTIEESAFEWCTSLTSVNIPDSVTTIGNYAFYYCNSLTSVYCKDTTPPVLGNTYVFDNNGSGRKIYVPAGSVNAYKSAYGWKNHASAIVGYDFENGVVVE